MSSETIEIVLFSVLRLHSICLSTCCEMNNSAQGPGLLLVLFFTIMCHIVSASERAK